jgi:hypothetical protein
MRPGDEVPEFELSDQDGKPRTLGELLPLKAGLAQISHRKIHVKRGTLDS